jgi:hypothetical protein
MSRPGSEPKNSEDHHRSSSGAMSSHPPDLNNAHVTNVEKLEKDVKGQHEEPVEQHRSSRRPRQRQHKSH